MNDALKTIDQARRKRDYVIVQQQLALDVPTIIIYFSRVPVRLQQRPEGLRSVTRHLGVLGSLELLDLRSFEEHERHGFLVLRRVRRRRGASARARRRRVGRRRRPRRTRGRSRTC